MSLHAPDSPVYSIDAATLDSAPPELAAALRAFFDEQEEAQAKADRQRQLDYQTSLADELLQHEGWVEVSVPNPDDDTERLISSFAEHVESCGPSFFEWPYVDEETGLADSDEELARQEYEEFLDEAPTVGQFYFDLYGLTLNHNGDVVEWDPEENVFVVVEKQPEILVNHRDREHPYQLYMNFWEYLRGVIPETSYIYMGSFWQPKDGFLIAKRNAMTTINGFCVDIDQVVDEKGNYFGGDWVMRSLLEILKETPELMPNYIMLSGTGIQPWYVFGERIPLLSAKKSPRRNKYQAVLKKLYIWFDQELPKNRFKVDVPCATISHAFRAPGSPSKKNYPTRLFCLGGRRRKMVSPLALSEFLHGSLKPYDLENWNQDEYQRLKQEMESMPVGKNAPATDKQLAYIEKLQSMGCLDEGASEFTTVAEADLLIKKGEVVFTRRGQYAQQGGKIKTSLGHIVKRRARDPKLYAYTLDRLLRETPAGTRYNALFGLAGLGWNCGIPKKQVERDLLSLLETDWAKALGPKDNKPLDKKDIRAALRGWSPLGALRTTEALEHRLGWTFEHKPRNHQTQHTHLHGDQWLINGEIKPNKCKVQREAGLALAKKLGHLGRPAGAGTKQQMVLDYAAAHPEANHSEIARALGVSRPTVVKWLRTASQSDSQQ